jgi:antitoxin HigA-1
MGVSILFLKFAGNGPGLWLRMQQAYDLWYAENKMKAELSKIETVASAIDPSCGR